MAESRFDVETGSVDLDEGVAHTASGDHALTPAELRVTRLLAARAGSAVSRAEIAAVLGGGAARAASRAVDALVSRLRHKLGDDGKRPRVLVTEHGVGYRLEPAAQRAPIGEELTSFVGREPELAWIREGVELARAVMVSGPSGAGKTRLVVRALAHHLGVVWCDGRFSTRADGALAIAGALGCRARTEAEAMEAIRRLDGSAARIVVIDETGLRGGSTRAAIERALMVTSHLRVVAIGQCDLEITGARSVWVGSLRADDASMLLLERARSVAPGFASDPGEAADVEAIVHLSDGLPGPIEGVVHLARTMSAPELASELRRVGSPFRTVPPSAQLLYRQLGVEVQRALERLCTFRGDFSLRDATRVLGADAAESVGNLAGMGFLARIDDRGSTWFRVYQFARAVARAGGDDFAVLADCRLRPVDQLVGPAAMAASRPYLASLGRWRGDLEWLFEIALDRDQPLEAARAALTLDPLSTTFGLDLDAQVRRFDEVSWHLGDPLVEAAVARSRAWMHRLLGHHERALRDARTAVALLPEHADSFLAARARVTLATILADGGAVDEAVALATEAVGRCEVEGWRLLRAVALNTLGVVEDARGDLTASRDAFMAALAAAEQQHDAERMAASLVNLAGVLTRLGSFDEAAACCRRSEEVDPEGAPLRAAAWNVAMGNLALAKAEPTEALERYSRAAATHARAGQARGEVIAETNAGWALLDLGRFTDATITFGRASSLARELGGGHLLAGSLLGLAVAHIGEKRLAAARGVLAEGRSLAQSATGSRISALVDALTWGLEKPDDRAPEALESLLATTRDDDVRQVVAALLGRRGGPRISVEARVLGALFSGSPATRA